jgi:prepilin-type N-terminal cleavage/methylation domain-containing protein
MRAMIPRDRKPERRSSRHVRQVDGFSLFELVLGLAILGILAGAAATIVLAASRTAARATRSLAAGRAVRSLQGFLQQELRDAVQGDVTALAPARVAFARPVGIAMVCAAGGSDIVIADTAWTGIRSPEAGRDSAWLLIDPVAEVWQPSSVVTATTDRCPDQAPALRLALDAPADGAVLVRVTEPVELSAYRSGVADWFGLTPASGLSVVQPFAGPLVPGTTEWVLFSDRLETRLQPAGAAATAVITPLAAGP